MSLLKRVRRLMLPVAACATATAGAASIDELIEAGVARANAGAAAQTQVERAADQVNDLLAQYKTEVKVVDGLKVYNELLQTQVNNQNSEMAALTESMDKVSLIERQIVPLMVRMIDSLDQFVQLDVPFLPAERRKRIDNLRKMMERSDVTAAEKFRRVLEAYQIENDFGRTIEAYRGDLEVEGRTLQVDFLRVGRIALLYQSVGGDVTGAWDKGTGSFHEIPPETYKAQVALGLKIARKQMAPDLMVVPVPAAAEVGQ